MDRLREIINMDNLPLLRDIHLPDGNVSIFPLAFGWWGLLCSLLGLYVLYLIIKIVWRQSAKIYARRILLSLKGDTGLASAVKLSEIMRRACVRKYPDAVAKSGKEWIAFLNSKSKLKLSGTAAILLQNAPFMIKPEYKPEDMQIVWNYCYEWIGENL